MEPRRIASYTLLEPIGHGGMAIVYRARHERLDRTVAIKVLSENLAASAEFIERFKREARTAASLQHPNVIGVHDFGENERGVPYLVLEYIEGPSLADVMDAGLDDTRISGLLDQIAAGLDYAHAHGVIHRDVKPANVLIANDGRVVLADFGLAWLMEGAHLTLAGGVIGTPEYMAPELASGDPIDHRSDVYALGVVLYEMLVGDRPFVAETPIAVLLKHLQDPAPSVLVARPELPAAVGVVLATALQKDPAERYASAGELARAFKAAMTTLPEPAQPTVGEAVGTVACPECGAALPPRAGICRGCMYLVPLDQLPHAPARARLVRREVIVNLLPHHLRWTPDGLQQARQQANAALHAATGDGWLPSSIGAPLRLVQGRTIAGPVVESAILTLERMG